MRIAIVGAGGVGGTFGARLAQGGADVVFIQRGPHLQAMRERGLALRSIDGDAHLPSVQATDRPAEVGPVDAVVFAVKSWQLESAAAECAPLMGDRSVALGLQNGVEAADTLARAYGTERVLAGMCRVIAVLEEPGVIRHFGARPTIVFGEPDSRRTERVEALRRALSAAPEVDVDVPDDVRAAIWSKFLFIASVSGIGAVTRAPLGVVLADGRTRTLLGDAMAEVTEVAAGVGVGLQDDIVERTLSFLDTLPPETTASMQRDIMEGRPSELGAQSGAVVRVGAEAGVPTPIHGFLLDVLTPLERRARGDVSW